MTGIERLTMASRYLGAQIEALEQHGFSKCRSLSALGINEKELSDKYNRFNILKLLPLYKAASQAIDDPYIDLRVGFKFRVSTFEQTGNVYTVCENLRQVVEMNRLYQRLAIYAGETSLIEENGHSYVHFEPFYDDIKQGSTIINVIFGSYGTSFRWLNWGSGQGLKAVFLRQAKPENVSVFQHVFDCPIYFDAQHNRLEFFPEDLDQPFPTRNPRKLARLRSQLNHIMNSEDSVRSFLEAVALILRRQMENGQVNFSYLKTDISLSDTKLRQAFARAETSYRTELDKARQTYFKELANGEDSFATIAQKLCYGDQAAFSRAFKRWYGCSPGEWTEDTPLIKKQKHPNLT